MTDETDAIDLLKDDHREVETLFKEYGHVARGDDAEAKEAVASEICLMLTVHAQIEEEIFYPAARELLDKQKIIDEAEQEHAEAKELIAQIEAMSPDDDAYDAKIKALGEAIAHHVDEEETEMFPKLRDAGMETGSFGKQMEERKQALMDQLGFVQNEEE